MNDQRSEKFAAATLIVFGRPNETKAPRAAWFGTEDVEGARIAALEMNLSTLDVDADETRAIVVELAEGRFSINGRAQIPTISVPVFERLVQIAVARASERAHIPPGQESEAREAALQENGSANHVSVQELRPSSTGPSAPSEEARTDNEILEGARKSAPPSRVDFPPDSIVPAIIVFGRSGMGRPRAGWFTAIEAPLARKAAGIEGFRWFPVQSKEQHIAAYDVSRGRLSGHRTLNLPIILMSAFEALNRLALQSSKEAEAVVFDEPIPSDSPPSNWDEVTAGDIVIAQDGEDGWWEAIVLNRRGDQLALAWQVNLDEPVFVRSVFEVAIPHPNLALRPQIGCPGGCRSTRPF